MLKPKYKIGDIVIIPFSQSFVQVKIVHAAKGKEEYAWGYWVDLSALGETRTKQFHEKDIIKKL